MPGEISRPSLGWIRRAGDRLRRALEPPGEPHRDQLIELRREIRGWRERAQRAAEEQRDRLRGLEASIEPLGARLAVQQRHLARVRRDLDRQRQLIERVVRHAAVDRRAIDAEARVTERLARLSRSRLPIVVGPWTGEVGFELLYWIPFLQWVRSAFRIDPERLIVVSRGGVRQWYGHVADRYAEIFEHVTPEQFFAATADRKKQQRLRAFDRQVVRDVMRARGLRHAHLLHPALMYRLFNAFWRYSATVKQLERFARFRSLPLPATGATLGLPLPERFVAVRFYFSGCFPDTSANREFAARVIAGLAARTEVVLLNSDLVVDEHRDFAPAHRSRVHLLGAHMRPETNLALQTAAISRATAFVGTYGGYSYLAPLCGVSSVAFFSHATFKPHHLELAQRAFARLGSARLVPVDVARADVLAEAMSGLVTTPALP